MGSSWVNMKSVRQACRLIQAADPAVLRQNFFLFQESSGFPVKAFDWLDEAHRIVEDDLLYLSWLTVDVKHIYKIPSPQYLAECLVESLDTGLAKLTQKTDRHSTRQAFFLQKILTLTLLLLHFAIHLDLRWNAVSVGSKISEAFWCHMCMIESF